MKRTILAAVATSVLLAAAPAWAERGTTILGAAIGGAAGAVVGREVGGHGGAVLGAALGGAAGALVAQDMVGYGRDRVREPAYVTPPAYGYGGYGGYGRPGYRRADVGNPYWLDGRDRDGGWDHGDRRHHDHHFRRHHHHGHGFDRGHR